MDAKMGLRIKVHAQQWGDHCFSACSSRSNMSTLILASPEKFQTSLRRSFTVSEKVNVLEKLSNEENNTSLSKFAKEQSIDRSMLCRWIQSKDDLLAANEQRATARRVSGAGRPSLIPVDVQKSLMLFVEGRRQNNLPVTPRMMYYEWYRIDRSIEHLSEHSARQRIYRFMRKSGLVIRRTTHHAQRARNDPQIIEDWMTYIEETTKAYSISKDRIANFDETDVQFCINTNTTVALRGEKTVAVCSPNSSNRCTVMLGVSAYGYKFPPYVIFKGKAGACVAKEIRKSNDNGYSNSCMYAVHPKAWMNEEMMLDWVQKIWKPYTDTKGGELTMLIIDQFSVHTMPSVKKAIEDCGTLVEFVPKGYTSCLQVCDIGLNKPFKDHMRAVVNEWMVANDADKRPDRQTVSHWIDHAWKKISHETIINTWAHIHIGCKMTAVNEQEEEGDVFFGSFMDDSDPRNDDVLALRESDEISTDSEYMETSDA